MERKGVGELAGTTAEWQVCDLLSKISVLLPSCKPEFNTAAVSELNQAVELVADRRSDMAAEAADDINQIEPRPRGSWAVIP